MKNALSTPHDRRLTRFQARTLALAQDVAVTMPRFTADDIAARRRAQGSMVSKTSAIDVALNYLAADRRLVRIRQGVFKLAVDLKMPASPVNPYTPWKKSRPRLPAGQSSVSPPTPDQLMGGRLRAGGEA